MPSVVPEGHVDKSDQSVCRGGKRLRALDSYIIQQLLYESPSSIVPLDSPQPLHSQCPFSGSPLGVLSGGGGTGSTVAVGKRLHVRVNTGRSGW